MFAVTYHWMSADILSKINLCYDACPERPLSQTERPREGILYAYCGRGGSTVVAAVVTVVVWRAFVQQ